MAHFLLLPADFPNSDSYIEENIREEKLTKKKQRSMDIRQFQPVTGGVTVADGERGRGAATASPSLFTRVCEEGTQNSDPDGGGGLDVTVYQSPVLVLMPHPRSVRPRFGTSSVCGRRRDMEDAVAICPSFFRKTADDDVVAVSHYFAVYDGHGCSHVATRCRDRLHELVKEELSSEAIGDWRETMERSFERMDKEVVVSEEADIGSCRCELQKPECKTVGSTAVVAVVTSEKIVIANCGDSRAVLCRNGKPVPLSSDHKPDRPDEECRIEEAGGRVIHWDGPRVLGILAMSRAIGDNYLKPYVIPEPEVTVTDRTSEDNCLILASDGLWDVVTNDTACGVAHRCLIRKERRRAMAGAAGSSKGRGVAPVGGVMGDKACLNASALLTKLALARHSKDNVSVVVIDLKKNT